MATSETVENGSEVVGKDGAKAKKVRQVREHAPVFQSEMELRAYAPPEGQKAYRVIATKDIKAGEVLGFTYEYNPPAACQVVLMKKEEKGKVLYEGYVNVDRLEKVKSVKELWDELQARTKDAPADDLPQELREMVARANSSSHVGSHDKTAARAGKGR